MIFETNGEQHMISVIPGMSVPVPADAIVVTITSARLFISFSRLLFDEFIVLIVKSYGKDVNEEFMKEVVDSVGSKPIR